MRTSERVQGEAGGTGAGDREHGTLSTFEQTLKIRVRKK